MDPKDLFRPILDFTRLKYGCSATPERSNRQREIEKAIVDFRPDALEAVEIIEAVAAGLKTRHPDCTEVLLRMSLLRKDLERLDSGWQTEAGETLAAYESSVRRTV